MQRIPRRIVWHDVMGNVVCDNICYASVPVTVYLITSDADLELISSRGPFSSKSPLHGLRSEETRELSKLSPEFVPGIPGIRIRNSARTSAKRDLTRMALS